jgi:hypothetical protein
MISKIAIDRLEDAHRREGRSDGKRVYDLTVGRQRLVLVIYQKHTELAERHYSRNVFHFGLLYNKGINPLKLLFHNNQDLIFIVEHGGERLDKYLKTCGLNSAKDKIAQAANIISRWNGLNFNKQSFVAPRPIEHFLKAWGEDKFRRLPKDLFDGLSRVHKEILDLIKGMKQKQYFYGYGRIDGDLINFAVKKGKVSTFDFDGVQEFYDLYYILAYLYVSLERTKNKKEALREHLLKTVDFDQKDARLRFFLGGVGAYSIEMYHRPQTIHVARTRLREIYELKKTLGL